MSCVWAYAYILGLSVIRRSIFMALRWHRESHVSRLGLGAISFPQRKFTAFSFTLSVKYTSYVLNKCLLTVAPMQLVVYRPSQYPLLEKFTQTIISALTQWRRSWGPRGQRTSNFLSGGNKAVTPSFDAMLMSLFSLYIGPLLVMDGNGCRWSSSALI